MVTIRPFRALHYNQTAVGDLSRVIAPPYDVIDEAHRDRLYDSSPYNVIRLILNREPDRYAAAAKAYGDWRAEKILIHDTEPCLYYYVQDFSLPDGSHCRRAGCITALRLESFDSGNVRPHERTFPKAKADRLSLLNACKANLSPIFGMYANRLDALSPARAQSEGEDAWIDVLDDKGDRHRVWRLREEGTIATLREALAHATVFIADGHHRYETALAYRDQCRAAGNDDPNAAHNFMLVYLTSMEEPGLRVFPTHRVWRDEPPQGFEKKLEEHFQVQSFPATEEGERKLLAALNGEAAPGSLGLRMSAGDRCCLLRLRDRDAFDAAFADLHPSVRYLDVTVLDAFLLRAVFGIDCTQAAQDGLLTYTHDDSEALATAREGKGISFLLHVPRMAEIEAVCLADQVMPEKSTYFYPKLQSGLVFHSLEAG
jgi:uncharacterized protein (DUF1015 family)